MGSGPKHHQISRALLAEIASGKYAPSGRLPSEAQLVERFGVSRPTVARALRDLQDQGLVERRVGSGSFVRQPGLPEAVRQLGLLIPGLGRTEIFEVICGELAGLALPAATGCSGAEGAAARTRMSRPRTPRRSATSSSAAARPASSSPRSSTSTAARRSTAASSRSCAGGVAVVLLDRDLGAFPSRSDLDLVGVDNFAGGYRLADHLLKLGCRNPIFAMRPRSASTVNARIAGAREAILDHGLTVPASFVRVGEPDDPKFARGIAEKGRMDAVLCANDHVAALLLRSLERAGIRVPEDVRMVGFDDVRFATLLSVPLTTMHQPCREIAQVALRAMLDRIDDPAMPPRWVAVSPRLVVRESCGAYRPRME